MGLYCIHASILRKYRLEWVLGRYGWIQYLWKQWTCFQENVVLFVRSFQQKNEIQYLHDAHDNNVGLLLILMFVGHQFMKVKGHWASSIFIPNFFPKKVGIFISLEVLAWEKTACQVLHSRLTYFWRNMDISSIFYFSKSTSINTQYSSLWGTLGMMLFTKYLIKWKRIGKISWNFRYWFNFKPSIELDIKR